MPQFTLKRLLASTALFALGIGLTIFVVDSMTNQRFGSGDLRTGVCVPLWLAAGASIGAGVFNFFKIPAIGAFFGMLFYFLGVALLIVFSHGCP